MAVDNESYLKYTNDFGTLGIKFLYLSNAGAIITLLANLNNFVDEDDYPIIVSAFGLFVYGLVFALVCNLMSYLSFRNLYMAAHNNQTAMRERMFGILAITSAVVSLFFFSYGAYQAFEIIESAL